MGSPFIWRQDFYHFIQHEIDDQTFENIFPFSLKRGLVSYKRFRPLKLYFGSLNNVEQTCWTTRSWWCCLSLNILSSIPAWSTTFSRLLCRLNAFPCASVSKINTTNVYITRAKAQFKTQSWKDTMIYNTVSLSRNITIFIMSKCKLNIHLPIRNIYETNMTLSPTSIKIVNTKLYIWYRMNQHCLES